MNDFDRLYQAARHNEWSYGYPMVLVTGLVALGVTSLIKNATIRRVCKFILVLACSSLAFEFSRLEVEEKWRLRRLMNELPNLTHEQQMAITSDGANRVAGPVAGGIVALMIFTVSVLILHLLQKVIQKRL